MAEFLAESVSGLLKGDDDMGTGSFLISTGVGAGGVKAGRGADGWTGGVAGSSRLFHILMIVGPPGRDYDVLKTLT
jgi:hypothetical protein